MQHMDRGVAQFGSASGLGPEGRRFKSCLPDHHFDMTPRDYTRRDLQQLETMHSLLQQSHFTPHSYKASCKKVHIVLTFLHERVLVKLGDTPRDRT